MIHIYSIFVQIFKFFIRILGKGSGSTWPGHVVLKIYPDVLKNKTLLPSQKVILVSGTNGKTTTTKMLVHVLEQRGFSVVTNASGSNLKNGLVTSLLSDFSLFGGKRPDFVVFEVDEFALTTVLPQLKTDILVLLNLSRDQLDRYGEVDLILERWEEVIKGSSVSNIVLDRSLSYFEGISFPRDIEISDTSDISKNTISQSLSDRIYYRNVCAALTVLGLLGISQEESSNLLSDFQEAYGRGERVSFENTDFLISLVKNPAGANTTLEMFANGSETFSKIFFILNDNIPDGRDVSWIYDIDPELLRKICSEKDVYVSGSRCYDMAVRIDYAEVNILPENVSPSLNSVLDAITERNGYRVLVLPNYSAMLELREIILGRKIL